MVVAHAGVFGKNDFDVVAPSLEFPAEAEDDVGQAAYLGYRCQLRCDLHDEKGGG